MRELQREEVLFSTPGGVDDDFMLAYANNTWGCWIVSNDRFADHVRDKGYRADWVEYHRCAARLGAQGGAVHVCLWVHGSGASFRVECDASNRCIQL